MELQRKLKRLPLLLIPIYTALMACGDSWTSSNLSVIAYGSGRRNAFVLWGLILAFYIPYFMLYLFSLAQYESKVAKGLLYTVSAFVLVSVTTPYLPAAFPFRSFLHIVFSFAFPLLFLGVFVLFLLGVSKGREGDFRVFWYIISVTAVGAMFLLLSLGVVTSLLELLLTVSTCLLLYLMERKLESFS